LKFRNKVWAGALLFFGSTLWLLVEIVLESYQPGYVGSIHYVSSLGSGITALPYNLSLILFGSCIIIASLFLQRAFEEKFFSLTLLITGIFVTGVGVFPETMPPMHGLFTGFTFIFAGLSAIFSYKILDNPFSYLSILIGILSIAFLFIFFPYLGLARESTETFIGLGKGTMERIIIYPVMFWIICFSGHLLRSDNLNIKK